jgi:hypothetical protein
MMPERVFGKLKASMGWMLVAFSLLPLCCEGQIPAAGRKAGSNLRAKVALLKDVDNELGASYGSFRADGEARLAALYYPMNQAEAFRLWEDAFFAVNGLKNTTVGVGTSKPLDSSSTVKLAAYIKGREATPASVKARIIRDLLRVGRREKAIEFLLLITRQDTPAPADGVTTQPVLVQRDLELPTVLMAIPVAVWKTQPQESYEYFRQIVAKFDIFPYMAADGYISVKPAAPGHVHLVAKVLLLHFDGQDLDPRNMAATRIALEQFTRILSDFDEADAKEGAHLVVSKLRQLKEKGWAPNTHTIQQAVCGYLTEGSAEKNELCAAQQAASNPAVDSSQFLPPEVRKIMEAHKTREEALGLARSDLSKAESLAAGIDEPLVRADLLADLAVAAWKDKENSADAARIFKQALATLSEAKVEKKSEYLESVIRLSLVASRYSRTDFPRTLQLGLVVMGEDSLRPQDDFEEMAYIDNGVLLLGLWARLDPRNALSRIKAIPDQKIRVLAMLAAAEAGSFQ